MLCWSIFWSNISFNVLIHFLKNLPMMISFWDHGLRFFFWRCKDCKQSNTNWFFSRPRPIKKENFSHQTFLGILLTTTTYLLDVFFRNGIDLLCSVTVCVFFLLLQLVLASGWLFLQWMRITILTFRAFRKVFDLLIGLYLCARMIIHT